ncbi:hypothetical protein ALO42_102447, partial [Pseudomonas syringae pv. atrofaciens]
MQVERQGGLVDVAEQVAEEGFVGFETDAQTGLSHVVAIRHRGGQQVFLTLHAGFDLMGQHGERGGVVYQVMKHQQRCPAVIDWVMGIGNAHHGCLADVQGVVKRVEGFLQLCGEISGLGVEANLFHAQLGMAPDHLDRFIEVFPAYAGAQDVVAGNHRLQGRRKLLHAFLTVKVEQHISPVRIILWGHQVVVKNAFLQRCQRIDILHVGHAARHTGHDLVDGVLSQVHQRQHVRGNPFAVLRNQVGRHHDFHAAAHGCGQRGQGWLAEQHAYIGAQVNLTHALDQSYGQQRVT